MLGSVGDLYCFSNTLSMLVSFHFQLKTDIPPMAMKWLRYRHKYKRQQEQNCMTSEVKTCMDNDGNKPQDDSRLHSRTVNHTEHESPNLSCDTKESHMSSTKESQMASAKKTHMSSAIEHSFSQVRTTDQVSVCKSKRNCSFCGEDCLQNYGHNMRQEATNNDMEDRGCLPLHDFLVDFAVEDPTPYLLPRKDLKRFIVMDIVYPCMQKSTCFTKRSVYSIMFYKSCYFGWGKFCENICKTFHIGVIFMILFILP